MKQKERHPEGLMSIIGGYEDGEPGLAVIEDEDGYYISAFYYPKGADKEYINVSVPRSVAEAVAAAIREEDGLS